MVVYGENAFGAAGDFCPSLSPADSQMVPTSPAAIIEAIGQRPQASSEHHHSIILYIISAVSSLIGCLSPFFVSVVKQLGCSEENLLLSFIKFHVIEREAVSAVILTN